VKRVNRVLHQPCCVCGSRVNVAVHFRKALLAKRGRNHDGVQKVIVPLCKHHYNLLTSDSLQHEDYSLIINHLKLKHNSRIYKLQKLRVKDCKVREDSTATKTQIQITYE